MVVPPGIQPGLNGYRLQALHILLVRYLQKCSKVNATFSVNVRFSADSERQTTCPWPGPDDEP
jgi:hypothetical protein